MSRPPVLGENPSPEQCRDWLHEVCRWLGLGFHPDTRGEEYVSASPDSVDAGLLLTPEEILLYNDGLDVCFAVLDEEIYVIGLDARQQILGDALSARSRRRERDLTTDASPPTSIPLNTEQEPDTD